MAKSKLHSAKTLMKMVEKAERRALVEGGFIDICDDEKLLADLLKAASKNGLTYLFLWYAPNEHLLEKMRRKGYTIVVHKMVVDDNDESEYALLEFFWQPNAAKLYAP